MALPPTTPAGLIRDSESINEWANSEDPSFVNRAGQTRRTHAGIDADAQAVIDDLETSRTEITQAVDSAIGRVDSLEMQVDDIEGSLNFYVDTAENAATSAINARDGAVTAQGQAESARDDVQELGGNISGLLAIGIGQSYVDADGDLNLTFVEPVTSVAISADGFLQYEVA